MEGELPPRDGEFKPTRKLTKEEIANLFGVTVEEMEEMDDRNGYSAAREEAKRQQEAFLDLMMGRVREMGEKIEDDLRRFSVTSTWKAKWWKRPWLWLRRKPTKATVRYEDCKITSISYDLDGGVSVDFGGRPVE